MNRNQITSYDSYNYKGSKTERPFIFSYLTTGSIEIVTKHETYLFNKNST